MYASHYLRLFTTLLSAFKNSFPISKLFICILLSLSLSVRTSAQSATVHVTIKNFKGSISFLDPNFRYDLTKKKFNQFLLDKQGSASYTMLTDLPNYFVLFFSSKDFFNYSLFLSPGDELFLTADFAKKDHQVTVTGKGSNNNQPEIFALTNMNLYQFNGDKTPDRVIATINKQYLLNKSILANYIKVNKPSGAFIKNATLNLKYFASANYYGFSHNNNLFKSKQELKPWLRVQDSLFATIKLSNDEALNAFNYTKLVDDFVFREPEALRMQRDYEIHPAEFYRKWFHTSPAQGKKLFDYSRLGILNNLVIDKYFGGKAAEYAFAQTIKYEFFKADYPYVMLVYNRFKKEFPASAYIKGFSPTIAEVVSKQRQTYNSATVFVKDNGTKLNTLKDVLALTKGKVAFVDMWGTWCTPCRQEIEKNAKKLEAHFKGKNVNFIYIANNDTKREQEWKKAIAYFQIGGMQVLASSALTKDIMDKVKSTGYPTYIIINKDGTYRQTSTQLPVNVPALMKEIEVANLAGRK